MADVKISQLPAATTPVSGTEELPLVQSGVTKKIALSDLSSISFGATGLTPATATSGAVVVAGTLDVNNGGTGLATLTANNVILGNGTSAPTFVAPSTSGKVLTSNGTTWVSSVPATSGTVTSVAMTVPSVLSISGSPITSSGTLALTYSGTALPVLNGGTGVTTSTGTTNVVLSNSPTLVTPALGAATATSIVSSGTAASSFTVTSGSAVPLTITNVGTGNSFVVEDSASTDSTPFVIDNAGNVTVGNALPASGFGQFQVVTSSAFASALIQVDSNATPSILSFLKTRGVNPSAQTIVQSGDQIGQLRFSGSDGVTYIRGAAIAAEVDGTPGVNDMPGRLVFSTTADGASSPTERVRIDSAGRLRQFGDTILSNVNVIGASYDSVSFSVAGEEITPQDLFFSPDGLKMYVIGSTGDDVNEYNLSTAWVVSSAVYSTVFSVASQETSPAGLFFRADGTKMYIVGTGNDTVYQYTLSTPWSVATASYDSISFSVAAQEISPSALWFKSNGLSMYVVGNTGDAVYQYTLSTAWNVSTATFLQSFSVSGQEAVPNAVTFTGDGSRMFVMGQTGDDVNVYNLTTPWDISTSAFVNVFSVAAQDLAPQGLYIKPDGTKMYMVGSTNDTVFQYTVPSIDIQLTGQTSVAALDVQQDLTVYGKLQAYSISASNGVLVTSPNGLGYGTGSGGAVTQLTSRTTGVTLSKPSGAITMFSAAGSIAAATFTVTNTLVAATDTIILNQKSGTNLYVLLVTAVAAGSFNVTFYTTGGIATDAPVINFSLIKGVTA